MEEIRKYISRDSARYATLVVERLVESVERLEAFPRSGRVVPEFQDDTLREVIWGNYRIVYRLGDENVQILTVFHGTQIPKIP